VGPVDLKLYTMDRYLKIVKYKTAFYSFYAPIALGMIFCGVCDAKSLKQARDICVKMGTYFQIQDDVLDAYAPPEVLGKINDA
jgi:farnesyl diphosphate synthase